ncbi:MAG TPA: diacylglycerol kinase family protein [Verrucomicrobiae bacterium]|nr:diacylglycerol kinase family protein [Verrucomicrobiae bacterium]
MAHYHVFFNKAAGTAENSRAIKAAFKKHSTAVSFYALSNLDKQIKKIAAQNNSVIVAAGGDGTVNAVVNAAHDTKIPIGVLPLGTFNHFAKDINMPLEPEAAVTALLKGKRKKIDAGEVNGIFFVNNSSIGLYPSLVARRDQLKSRFGKAIGTIIAAGMVLAKLRRRRIHLTFDKKQTKLRSPFVFIGNNRYETSGNEFINRKRMTEGVFSVYVVTTKSFFSLVWSLFRSSTGGKKQQTAIKQLTAQQVALRLRHTSVVVAFDGEIRSLKSPLQYTLHHKYLTIIAP